MPLWNKGCHWAFEHQYQELHDVISISVRIFKLCDVKFDCKYQVVEINTAHDINDVSKRW